MDAKLENGVADGRGVGECTIARDGEGKDLMVYLSEAMQLCMAVATDFKERGNPVGHLLAVLGSEIWTARVNRAHTLRGWKVSFATAETQEVVASFVELHRVLERAQATTGCRLPVEQLAAALEVWRAVEEKKTLQQVA